MKYKKLSIISNIIFFSSSIFALGVLAKNYIDRSKVPAGVCPIENNRSLMIVSIVILVLAFIFTTIIDRKLKKVKKE